MDFPALLEFIVEIYVFTMPSLLLNQLRTLGEGQEIQTVFAEPQIRPNSLGA